MRGWNRPLHEAVRVLSDALSVKDALPASVEPPQPTAEAPLTPWTPVLGPKRGLGCDRSPFDDRHQESPMHHRGQPSEASASRAEGRLPGALPLVGRNDELATLEALLETRHRPTAAAIVCGEGGVGKSRLVEELAGRAARRGWSVAKGRAYPVETGIPYALFSDAFLPMLRELDREALTVLSRGGEAELRYLFPALDQGPKDPGPMPASDPEEFRTRLLWNFTEFLKNYAVRTPLLVVMEDLQWADESSLQLLHFVARQAAGAPLVLLCTYSESERERSPHLTQMERSLVHLGVGQVHRLGALGLDEVTELVCRTFGVDAELVREFAAVLFGWTRGNPFFLDEVLKALVESGRLTRKKGAWIGWDARHLGLPGSIRDAVLARLAGLSPSAQRVADLSAVIGARAGYALLVSISGLGEADLLASLEELCAQGVLSESSEDGSVHYTFTHPLVRETLYSEFGLQRARLLHGAVAEAMEAHWGSAAREHADELAFHYARTDSGQHGARAVLYLAAAGARALERHAEREGANYLKAALERLSATNGVAAPADVPTLAQLATQLARAHLRLGEYEQSITLWSSVLSEADPDGPERTDLLRSIGLAHYWNGDPARALDFFEAGLESALARDAGADVIHLRLARGSCFQEMGRGSEAREEIEKALPTAHHLGDRAILARVHRSAALTKLWIGPPEEAQAHGEYAIELARSLNDPAVEFWAHWALGVLAGLTGDVEGMAEGIEAARDLADRLRSPVLRLRTDEASIELAYATGDWVRGVALGEQSIRMARTLNQRTLLPRLLVWTALIYMGRGDMERAKELVDEACDMSGMGSEKEGADVHVVIPAHIGLASYLIADERYEEAIQVARRGLEVAEGTGYILWLVHRLLPTLAEACLWAERPDDAEAVGRRMRAHAEKLNHKLGLAWADACDALVHWKRGDSKGGAVMMRAAAEALEAVPMVPYAARIRRQLAGRLWDLGDREAALHELRYVHDVFVRLGAERELEKARAQFREVGSRPPPRGAGVGMTGLTERELEIARLVARRKSNKAVGRMLSISPRTVSTHLSNIFQKLDLTSRGELADLMRSEGLVDD